MKSVWTLTGGMLFAATIGWSALSVASLLAHGEYTEQVTYEAADVRSIDIANDAGGVTVRRTDAATASGHITVVSEISDGLRRTEHSSDLVDGVLVVRASCPTLASLWCDAQFILEVPRDIAVTLSSGEA